MMEFGINRGFIRDDLNKSERIGGQFKVAKEHSGRHVMILVNDQLVSQPLRKSLETPPLVAGGWCYLCPVLYVGR